MDLGQADQLATAVRELRQMVAAQAAEIAELRSELAELTRPREPPLAEPPLVTGRRRFLAMAGGAAAVAVGSSLAGGSKAAATNGVDMVFAGPNVASVNVPASTTVLDYSPAAPTQVDYFRVTDNPAAVGSVDPVYARYLPASVAGHARTNSDRVLSGVTGLSEVASGNGVLGIATGSGGSYGVWGISETGNGVVGRSLSGYDFFGDGAGRLGLSAHVFVGPPQENDGTYAPADIIRDSQGSLWTCVIAGKPGVWRKLAGPNTAGAFHTITPTRVYDSRCPQPIAGQIDTGMPRTVSVADGRSTVTGDVVQADLVPGGATAIACNVTVVDTVGGGYAVINPGLNSVVGASTINWSQSGQVLANGIIVGIDDARRVTIVVGGGGYTNIVLDVTGYWR